MNEILFEFADGAILLKNIFLSLIVTSITATITGIIFGSLRLSLRDGLIGFLFTELILIIILVSVRDKVRSERLNYITEKFSEISTNSAECSDNGKPITDWKYGLSRIEKCPREVGYYLKTCDLLEDDHDYESAALILELGLDIIRISPPPPPVCERLQRYYKHLPNRPELSKYCDKIHRF
jgi:hypothetical protein